MRGVPGRAGLHEHQQRVGGEVRADGHCQLHVQRGGAHQAHAAGGRCVCVCVLQVYVFYATQYHSLLSWCLVMIILL